MNATQIELVIPAGTSVRYDQDVRSQRIINHGSIILAPGVTLSADELVNEGSIASANGNLNIKVGTIATSDGSFEAPDTIRVSSAGNLTVRGGRFIAPAVRFESEGDLDVNAKRVDGAAYLHAQGIAFGVEEGDLNIAESCSNGDPVIWSTGALSCGAIDTSGEDLVLLSNGAITINGDINTGSGKLTVGAGVGFTPPQNPPFGSQCGGQRKECSSCDGLFSILPDQFGTAPFTVNGKIDSQAPGFSVTIWSSETIVNGKLNIAATFNMVGGRLTVNSDDSVFIGDRLIASQGDIVIKAIDSPNHNITIMGEIQCPGNNVILAAGGNIRTGNITNYSPTNIGDIRIYANYGATGATDLFIIGGSGNANGVNGTIRNTSDTGTPPPNQTRNIHIKNGGTGAIYVTDAAKIITSGSQTGAASVFLDGTNGDVQINSGVLSTDASGDKPAGSIALLGEKVITGDHVVISASHGTAGPNHTHYVTIAAAELIHGFNLNIYTNGPQSLNGGIFIAPKGSTTVPVELDPDATIDVPTFNPPRAPMTINGSGQLTLDARGPDNKVVASGYPLTIWSHTDIFALGERTSVDISYTGSPAGNSSLLFPGNGPVRIYADNDAGDAGRITIQADRIGHPLDHVSLNANALGSSGIGGLITFNLAGGEIKFGAGNECYSASARSASTSNTKASKVVIANVNGQVTFDESFDAFSIITAALPGNADGGDAIIDCNTLVSNVAGATLYAAGEGSGKGGLVEITTAGALTIGSGSGDLGIDASSHGTGHGGKCRLTATGNLVVSTANLTVEAAFQGGSSQANGGEITLSTAADLTLSGSLVAKGKNDGAGGTISLTGQHVNISQVDINADGGETGKAGSITIQSLTNANNEGLKLENGPILVSAKAGAVQAAGSIRLKSNRVVTIGNQVTIDGSPHGADGNGSTITIESGLGSSTIDNPITITGVVNADGGTAQGSPGNIDIKFKDSNFTANQFLVMSQDSSIRANLLGSGSGATITVVNTGSAGALVGPNGKISAQMGKVKFQTPNDSADVAVTLMSLVGDVTALGNEITITVYSDTDVLSLESLVTNLRDVTINAVNTQVVVRPPASSTPSISATEEVKIEAKSLTIGQGTSAGQAVIQAGTFVDLSTPASSNGNISIGGDITAPTTNVSNYAKIVAHGTGSILGASTAKITANKLEVSAENGHIRDDSGQFLLTKAAQLNAKTAISGSGEIRVRNENLDPISTSVFVLDNGAESGGLFSLQTTGNLQAGTIIAGGNISLYSNTGDITIRAAQTGIPPKTLSAQGNITIQTDDADGLIFIFQQDVIEATGNISLSVEGGSISGCSDIGLIPGPSCRPAAALVTVAPTGVIYWNNSIEAGGSIEDGTATVFTVGTGKTMTFTRRNGNIKTLAQVKFINLP